MNGKMIAGGIIGILVVGGGGFYAGTKYQASQTPASRFTGGAGTFAGRTGTGRGGAGNGAVFGTVIAKDSNGITVELGGPNATSTNGTASGTRIVLVNSSTQVGKMVSGSANDLSVGTSVTILGTPNSDGSLTATSVQIRPANTQR
jgi:Domain of unknown function (DUF5666)